MDEESNKQFDMGFLTLFDANPVIEGSATEDDINTAILNKAGSNIYFMFRKMRDALKAEIDERQKLPQELQEHDFEKSKYALKLPVGNTVFPRSRKIPKKKQATKWEKFAQEKGIKKKKRSGMAFDEETQKYLPRWGSKSKKNFEPAIMEEKKPGVNPFEQRKLQKKLRVSKQELRQTKNRARSNTH